MDTGQPVAGAEMPSGTWPVQVIGPQGKGWASRTGCPPEGSAGPQVDGYSALAVCQQVSVMRLLAFALRGPPWNQGILTCPLWLGLCDFLTSAKKGTWVQCWGLRSAELAETSHSPLKGDTSMRSQDLTLGCGVHTGP